MIQKRLIYNILLLQLCCLAICILASPEEETELRDLLQATSWKTFHMLDSLERFMKAIRIEERAIASAIELNVNQTKHPTLKNLPKAEFIDIYDEVLGQPCSFFKAVAQLYEGSIGRILSRPPFGTGSNSVVADVKSYANLCKRIDETSSRLLIYQALKNTH